METYCRLRRLKLAGDERVLHDEDRKILKIVSKIPAEISPPRTRQKKPRKARRQKQPAGRQKKESETTLWTPRITQTRPRRALRRRIAPHRAPSAANARPSALPSPLAAARPEAQHRTAASARPLAQPGTSTAVPPSARPVVARPGAPPLAAPAPAAVRPTPPARSAALPTARTAAPPTARTAAPPVKLPAVRLAPPAVRPANAPATARPEAQLAAHRALRSAALHRVHRALRDAARASKRVAPRGAARRRARRALRRAAAGRARPFLRLLWDRRNSAKLRANGRQTFAAHYKRCPTGHNTSRRTSSTKGALPAHRGRAPTKLVPPPGRHSTKTRPHTDSAPLRRWGSLHTAHRRRVPAHSSVPDGVREAGTDTSIVLLLSTRTEAAKGGDHRPPGRHRPHRHRERTWETWASKSEYAKPIRARSGRPGCVYFTQLTGSAAENAGIYGVTELLYMPGIKIEAWRGKKGPAQCHRCQAFRHASACCHRPLACVRCGGEHAARDCPRPREEPATCANCGGPHPANHAGCPAYKKEARNKRASTVARTKASRPGPTTRASCPQPTVEETAPATLMAPANAPNTRGTHWAKPKEQQASKKKKENRRRSRRYTCDGSTKRRHQTARQEIIRIPSPKTSKS